MQATPLPSLWPSAERGPADVLRIAHRGGANQSNPYGEDNLRRIAGLGTHLLEFDVQTTRDDALVVSHDPEIVTPSGSAVRIDQHSLDELRAAVVADHGDLDFGVVVRRARDVGLGLYIDVKTLTAPAAARLAHVVDTEAMLERTILASADPSVLALCADAAPHLPRSILFGPADLDALELARSVNAHFVHPCWERLPRPHELLSGASWLGSLRSENRGIVCWHVEDLEVAQGLYALAVDGICTDEPELLAAVAASGGGDQSIVTSLRSSGLGG